MKIHSYILVCLSQGILVNAMIRAVFCDPSWIPATAIAGVLALLAIATREKESR